MTGILHHIDPDDVPLDEAMLFYGKKANKGLVRDYHIEINADEYTADFSVTTWTRNPRRAVHDQRDEPVGQHALVTFTSHELVQLQKDIAGTLLYLSDQPVKGA